MKLTVL